MKSTIYLLKPRRVLATEREHDPRERGGDSVVAAGGHCPSPCQGVSHSLQCGVCSPGLSCLLSSLHKRPQTTNVQRKDQSNAELKNMLATFEVCHLLYQINSQIINIRKIILKFWTEKCWYLAAVAENYLHCRHCSTVIPGCYTLTLLWCLVVS